jgi:ribonucleoside-diphosphate reductase alpha chain
MTEQKTEKWILLNNELAITDENGQFQLEKDKEAVHSYFVDHINRHTQFFYTLKEKLKYLFENDYYDRKVFNQYSFKELKTLYQIAYAEKFRFQSFMAAFKFYNNYALRTNDKKTYLERYEDRVVANGVFLGDGDFEKAKRITTKIIKQEYQPATPTFLNAGRKRAGRMISCFLLTIPDTTEGIMYAVESAAQLSRYGGGVGLNLSKLRGETEDIKKIEGASTSVVGVAKILEQVFLKFNQLGQRNVAGAAYLNAFHSDIIEFLSTKKLNSDDAGRLNTLSIGTIVSDKLYKLAEEDKDWYTFYPHSVYKAYGKALDDMDMNKMYDALVRNPKVRKKAMGNARSFFELIAKIQIESGYPYLVNIDQVNKVHTLKDIDRIEMSNLCTEIFQLQTPSVIGGYAGKSAFGKDVSCNLGSLNIVNVMEHKDVRGAVSTGIDALTTVARRTSFNEVPTVKNGNESFHSVGLGAMNLHGFLAKNQINYESFEARDFANVFFAMVRYYSLKRSMEIAKEYGSFKGFERSEYAKGTALQKYIKYDFLPRSERVWELFDNINIPTQIDWIKLNEDIITYGLYHAYLNAIAPTQSISYIQNATQSVLPIMEQVETRKYGDSSVTYFPMPYLSPKTYWFYKSAYRTNMYRMIDMIAVIQQHVDQGISATLFVDGDTITTGKLARLYIYAHKRGLKSLYYTRTKSSSNEECFSCSV